MRGRIALISLALAMALTGFLTVGLGLPGEALAQVSTAPVANPTRDCHTVRTCRFQRGGSYRGCISTYTCRTCKLVQAPRCNINGQTGNCVTMQCSWGGSP